MSTAGPGHKPSRCKSVLSAGAFISVVIVSGACTQPVTLPQPARSTPGNTATDTQRSGERERMLREQIAGRGIRDRRVLDAMREVPRHDFVPASRSADAYDDRPLPIGHEQTISQPYIVALMTELARPSPKDRALEIGTGSGYQAAVLSKLVAEVYSIEIVVPLARQARERLQRLGYDNVTVRAGDGYAGWPGQAPFDLILLTAAPEQVPGPLIEQLARGGRLVAPVGPQSGLQELRVMTKQADGSLHTETITPVRFVPFTRSPPAGNPD